MTNRRDLVVALLGLLSAACASPPANPLEVPSYAADDPRPQQGGFVRDVRLEEVERDETKYILMAWRVGDVLTLGAMTQGPFVGHVRWSLDDALFDFDVVAKPASQDVPVRVTGAPAAAGPLRGETAGFRDYRWTNIDLASPVWLSNDQCALSVTFEAADGAVVTLPDRGAYAVRMIQR